MKTPLKFLFAQKILLIFVALLGIAAVVNFFYLVFKGNVYAGFIVSIFFGVLFFLYLWLTHEEQQKWLPRYKEWKQTATKLGLEESSERDFSSLVGESRSIVTGYYRGHHVKLYPINIYGSEPSDTERKTQYVVDLKNPKPILMYLRRIFTSHILDTSLSDNDLHDMRMNDPEFEKQFMIKGKNEREIRDTLNPSIRAKLMNELNTISELYIGFSCEKSHEKLLFGKKIIVNDARCVDSQTLNDTKGNAEKFQAILDVLIDLVEKIDAKSPSV